MLLTAVLFVREVLAVNLTVANPVCWNTEAVFTRPVVVRTCYSHNHNTHTIHFTRTHLVSHHMRVALELHFTHVVLGLADMYLRYCKARFIETFLRDCYLKTCIRLNVAYLLTTHKVAG